MFLGAVSLMQVTAARLASDATGPHVRHTAPDGGHAVALARCLAVSTHLPPDVRAALAATPPARVLERALHMHPPEQLELVSLTRRQGQRQDQGR